MNNDLIQLGVCHKPHGIKGGFTFLLENMQDSVLQKGVKVLLLPKDTRSSIPDNGEEFEISKISFGNKAIVYLKKDGQVITNRNTVEEMLPFFINIDRSALPEVEEDEFYLADLVNLKAIDPDTKDELGKVLKTFDNGAQVVLVIKLKSGKKVDVPFVENFVPVVDIENGIIEVHMPRFV